MSSFHSKFEKSNLMLTFFYFQFYKFQEQYVEYDELVTLSENFKYLQRLTFNISFVSDYFVTKFIANRALEELQFSGNHKVTGSFLNKIKLRNLKALNFKNCKRLDFDLNVIPGLKKLELNYVPWSICEPIIQVLNKLQELEHLELILSFNTANDMFFECVSKLSRLKHLNVNIKASNDDLVLLSMGCMELRSLLLANCTDISGLGVTALCSNAGERLTTLGLKCSDRFTDDNVVTIIKCCPNLTFLDVSDC
ncbi:F-box/LRR-repeat protein 2-like isoform X2 [Cydia pomonella]|uniref:F-box/LRR-repeat protein 2-like isoform X2 n=1 Tax=Cydia pomonella TaxID=82600 RepID=UPI002ADD5052|nr:F-box/LRR-repeat protein 2-like isoform X2 [Cydia pomonella]